MLFNKKSGTIALVAALQPLLFGLPAGAETIFVETPTIISEPVIEVAPQAIIRTPARSTTIIKEKAVVVPQVVPAPVVLEPASTVVKEQTTTTTVKKTALPATDATVSTEIDVTLGPKPAFHRRLNLMKEQVSLGLSRGWLTPAEASEFHGRLNALLSDADAVALAVTDRSMPDAIEARANTLNIEITNSMKTYVGSGPLMQ